MTEDSSSAIGRREFLTASSAAAAIAALGGCIRRPEENILPYVRVPERMVPGMPLHFATVTKRGRDALGILVTSHEGRPTKVEGNPDHPSSGGATDVQAQASILDLYDPDRSRSPARGGAGGFSDASWAEFDAALAARLALHAADHGAGLRILSRPTNSPTVVRLRAEFLARFPGARVHAYAPVHDGNAREGARVALGEPMSLLFNLAPARVVLSLDADFLGTAPSSARNARGFAAARNLESAAGEMNRLYVAEPSYTVTGAAADHRLPLRGSEIGWLLRAITLRLARELSPEVARLFGGDLAPSLAHLEPWVGAVSKDLAANVGRSLIVVGPRQPAWVHALACGVNAMLGNFGQTIHRQAAPGRLATPSIGLLEATDPVGDLFALTESIASGAVKTLIVLGGNPVYDAPADADFTARLQSVEFSAHLASHRNETARLCTWHLPEAHELEAWGDQRSGDGTIAIQQPLIAPLWGGRSEIELLAQLGGATELTGRAQVQASLAGISEWRFAVQRGVAWTNSVLSLEVASTGMGFPQLNRPAIAAAQAAAAAPQSAGIELAFAPCPKVIDGASANNAWLLELPDPMTKISWDNVALMSPAMAGDLGVESKDVIRITVAGKSVEIPAWILPGHADRSITLHTGWGRTAAGRYGDGQGTDVGPLRTRDGFFFTNVRGSAITKTGRRAFVSQTQEHDRMEGRPIAIDATVAEYRATPDFAQYRSVEASTTPLWPEIDYSGVPRWGMTIDLTKCTGCSVCVVACQAENNIPAVGKNMVARGREMHWLRIDRYFVGEGDPRVAMQPVTCQHCEQAPCENVCPVAATSHSPDGLNDMAYNRCIGTRYCMNNCPYKVRRFNYLSWHDYIEADREIPEVRKLSFNPNVTVRMRGVVEKCTYCVQRIEAAKIQARREGRPLEDIEFNTACAAACPSQAITFGDLNRAESDVARSAARDRRYKLLAEIGTKPRTTFLARIRNPNPDLDRGSGR